MCDQWVKTFACSFPFRGRACPDDALLDKLYGNVYLKCYFLEFRCKYFFPLLERNEVLKNKVSLNHFKRTFN